MCENRQPPLFKMTQTNKKVNQISARVKLQKMNWSEIILLPPVVAQMIAKWQVLLTWWITDGPLTATWTTFWSSMAVLWLLKELNRWEMTKPVLTKYALTAFLVYSQEEFHRKTLSNSWARSDLKWCKGRTMALDKANLIELRDSICRKWKQKNLEGI